MHIAEPTLKRWVLFWIVVVVVVVLLVVAELTVTSRLGSLGECSDHHKCAHWINFDAHSLLGILVFVPKLENFGSRVLARTQFLKAFSGFCFVFKQPLLVSVCGLWLFFFFLSPSINFVIWVILFTFFIKLLVQGFIFYFLFFEEQFYLFLGWIQKWLLCVTLEF